MKHPGLAVGPWTVHSLIVGRFRLDGGAMFGVVPKPLWNRVAPADEANRIRLSMRCLLLKGPDRTVLVDTGIGHKDSQKFLGLFAVEQEENELVRRLDEVGVSPCDITDLVLTHLHFDHCGGCYLPDGDGVKPLFPGVRLHLQKGQWNWAFRGHPRDRASYIPRNFERMAQDHELILHEGEGEILPGLRALCVDGHTPRMQMIHVVGDPDAGVPGLVFLADLVPTAAHLPLPWVMGYDLEPLKTVIEKENLYARVLDGRTLLAFEHDPDIAAVVCEAGPKGPEIIQRIETM